MKVVLGKCSLCQDEYTIEVQQTIAKEHPDWNSYSWDRRIDELKKLHAGADLNKIEPDYNVVVFGYVCYDCGGETYVCKKHLQQALEMLDDEEISS